MDARRWNYVLLGVIIGLLVAYLSQSAAQLGPLPTYTAFPSGQTIPAPTLTGNVTGAYTLVSPQVSGVLSAPQGAFSTAAITPVTLVGDIVLGKQTNPTALAPGAGAVTLRARASNLVPGACRLVAIAGTAATETTLFDPIGQGC